MTSAAGEDDPRRNRATPSENSPAATIVPTNGNATPTADTVASPAENSAAAPQREDARTRPGDDETGATPTVVRIPIDQIIVPRRGRRDVRNVEELAESIRLVGLLAELLVVRHGANGRYRLVGGRRRLEASKLLGWQDLPCKILNMDALTAELAGLDENLLGPDLTVLERAEMLARRQKISEALYPSFAKPKGGRPAKNGESISPFTTDTARKAGVTPRTVKHELQIGKGLTEATEEAVRGSRIEDQKAPLLKLARMEPDKQLAAAQYMVEGKARKAAATNAAPFTTEESLLRPGPRVPCATGRVALAAGRTGPGLIGEKRMSRENVDECIDAGTPIPEPRRDEVSILIMHDSPPGRAMWQKELGNPEWPRAHHGGAPACLVRIVASSGRVRELLMRYGGKAGTAIAATLLQTGWGDQRFVTLDAAKIILRGWKSGRDMFSQTAALEAPGRSPRGRFVFEISLLGDETATCEVPTFIDGLMVWELVRAADEATTPARNVGRDAQALAEECLASVLLEAFARQPDNAVRAAEALWWSGNHGKSSVMRILWSRPELRALAERVQREILS